MSSETKDTVPRALHGSSATENHITIFMCGDVMTGRGIDQVLPHPSDPRIYERYVKDATRYVELAEQANGPIPHPVDFSYVWGDALDELERMEPDVQIINLETSITESDDYWRGKGINYRMNPKNIPCITAAGIDCCALANNHVLDWGYAGLTETLETLQQVNVQFSGAGRNLHEAAAPAVMEVAGTGRVVAFSFGSVTSGIPRRWAASHDRPGINLLPDMTDPTVRSIGEQVGHVKQDDDVIVASIHWGGNWGYEIPREQRSFAHALIDHVGVDVVHGHSSHHVKGIEVYDDRLILYGCGDFLTDYEGINGYEDFRDDLGLMYFARLAPTTGALVSLHMTPTRIERFRVHRASVSEAQWLRDVLNREGQRLGSWVELNDDNTLTLHWE